MPAYAPYDSFASSRRTADSIYYTAKEFDSADESDCMRHMPMMPPMGPMPPHSRRPSVIDSLGPVDAIFSRRYVDPWDLENYVYIRKQVLDPNLETEVPPSPAGEPIQSKFYYVPGDMESCRECSAEIVSPAKICDHDLDDEEDDGIDDDLEVDELDVVDDPDGFYTERYDTVMEEDSIAGDEHVYSSYTDLETSSADHPSSCDSPMSALRLHTPGFGKTATSRRPIVLPKPLPQLEFPGPPSYEPYYEPSCCPYMPLPPPVPPHHPHAALMDVPDASGNYYSLAPVPAPDCFECARAEVVDHVPLYATGGRQSQNHSPIRRRSRSASVVSMSLARRPSLVSVGGGAPVDPTTAVSIAATNANVCYTPQHFSLSKKGLLQIDYSCNWENLDRFITK